MADPNQTTAGTEMLISVRFNSADIDPQTLLDEVADLILARYPKADGVITSLSRYEDDD